MAKTKNGTLKTKRPAGKLPKQLESVYFLKLVLYVVLGAQWIRFVGPNGSTQFPIPVGLLIGILFAMHDHFKIDRKIEFAVLLIAMLVGFWSQMGIYIHLS